MKNPTDSREFSRPREPPLEVFYVVRTTAVRGENDIPRPSAGERQHCLSSALYETRPQAQGELDRLQRQDASGAYSVWKSETYIEPAEWQHRVVRVDGTMVLPRLRGTSRGLDG